MIRARLLILAVAMLGSVATLCGQTAGWQGRRGVLLYNAFAFPSVRHEPLPIGRWNLRQELGAHYVLRPWLMVGARLGGLTTRLPLEVQPLTEGVALREEGLPSTDYLRISTFYMGAQARVFWPKPAGSLAPLGLYAALSVDRHIGWVVEAKESSQRASVAYGGTRFGTLDALAVNVQVGNQLALGQRFLVDMGVQMGVLAPMGYATQNQATNSLIDKWVGKRLFHHNGINVVLGAGWLF
jgi:hypothetical protein